MKLTRRAPPPRASRVAGRQLVTRLLAAAGVEDAAAALAAGRVCVNGRVSRGPRARADPLHEVIALDGTPLAIPLCRYVLFHKPYGVVSHFTNRDSAHETLADYVSLPDVYAVGRLDWDSEGLLLLTDDGWLNHRLTEPRFGQPRTYLVQVEGVPAEAALAALRRGVSIEGLRTLPAQVRLLSHEPDLPPRRVPIRTRQHIPTAWLELTLTEGRTHQVRRMTAAVGYPTLRLVRVGLGPLSLGGLAPAQWRELTEEELQALRAALGSQRAA